MGSRNLVEPLIELLIRVCGWSSILFVAAIFFFVLREAAPMLFGKLNLVEFFTSTDWQPTSDVRPRYGILALLVGTLSVSLLAMAHGRAAGPGGRGLHFRVLSRPHERNAQDHDRAVGGHPVDRVGIHRLHGAGTADYPA